MPVKSLVELATSAIFKNIKELDNIGDYLPYQNVRHILMRVDNAPQLRQIEINSPQIEGETGELWLKLIERDFPLEVKAKGYKPQNPKKWYRVWEKYKRDHDDALAESENKLRSALAGLQENKEKNLSKIVGQKQLPKSLRIGSRRVGQGHGSGTSNFDFGSGRKLKAPKGTDVMRKVRREANAIAMIHSNLSRPSIAKSRQQQRLASAPSTMREDFRRESQSIYRRIPKEHRTPSAVVEHESKAEFISDSEEDDMEDDHDLFDYDDDQPPRSNGKAAPSMSQSHRVGSASASIRPQIQSQKRVSSAAATSLLKKRPTASSSASGPSKASASSSSSKPRSGGILSNSHKPSASSKVQSSGSTLKKPASSQLRENSPPRPKLQQQTPSQKVLDRHPESPPKLSYHLPQTQTSPPLAPSNGPKSPPPILPTSALSPDQQPRKRKAVDIFMRPKKKLPK